MLLFLRYAAPTIHVEGTGGHIRCCDVDQRGLGNLFGATVYTDDLINTKLCHTESGGLVAEPGDTVADTEG